MSLSLIVCWCCHEVFNNALFQVLFLKPDYKVSSSSSSTLSAYNDIARSTISLPICLFCAIFSCSFTWIVLKLPSLLFFTNVLNSTFSKSFPICLIHVNFCPPLGFLRGFFASFNDFLAGASSGNLKRWPYHVNLLRFTVWLDGVYLSPYRVYHCWLCLANLDSKFSHQFSLKCFDDLFMFFG